ncbi:MAG: hypothetical protein HY430_00620 [Candidatus Levybacteria bacterium]|nr:hypothetical protein [Candidatus Levybacteria bacterium]
MFTEILSNRDRPDEVFGVIEREIEAATGEQRQFLLQRAKAILEKDEVSLEDANLLTSILIDVVGGTKIEKSNTTDKFSKDAFSEQSAETRQFVDEQTGHRMSFWWAIRLDRGSRQTIEFSNVRVEKNAIQETLQFETKHAVGAWGIRQPLEKIEPEVGIAIQDPIAVPSIYQVASYVTGKQEEVRMDPHYRYSVIPLSMDQLKGFYARVFDVVERQQES